MQLRCLGHSRPWASRCHGPRDVAHGTAKCFPWRRPFGGGQGRRYCPGFTDKKGNASATQRAFKSEPDLEVLKASLPAPLHPRQQGPRPQLLCPTPALDGLGCLPVHGAYIPGAGEGVDWLISPRG